MRLESTNTFLTVTSLAMFSVTGVLVGLLVCAPESGASPDCDPAALEIQCPEGQFCSELGYCLDNEPLAVDEPLPDCNPGERTTACRCPDHLEVRDEVCDVPAAASVCEHADVASLLQRLRQKCTEEGAALVGNLSGCEPAALDSVIIGSHDLTMKIARSFREQSFTLHFDIGTPRTPRAATTWPPGPARRELVKDVKEMLARVEPRGYLLLVSFASPIGNNARLNYDLARRRSDAAVALISKARTDFPALAAALSPLTTIVGVVGDEQQAALNLQDFDAIWGATDRFHAWDDAATARIKRSLAAWRDDRLAPAEAAWLLRTIQQSVLVLPLACDSHPAEA